jgi:hypothetical protein
VNTEAIDKLFLELSQFTNATTAKELHYRAALQRIADRGSLIESAIARKALEGPL